MKILVVNDDGIKAEGIRRLAALAKQLGEVWVVAPAAQCSAMSSRITVCGELVVCREEFPVDAVTAYSVSGTPADCVKVALSQLMEKKPDIVFSGINDGYNVGYDIQYSGTVGAAMEAVMSGIPAIAFSSEKNGIYDVVEEYFVPVAQELIKEELPANVIWNVNFPGCTVNELRGIRRGCVPAQMQFYQDHFDRKEQEDGSIVLTTSGIPVTEQMPEGSDIRAVQDRYIAIGKLKNMIAER